MFVSIFECPDHRTQGNISITESNGWKHWRVVFGNGRVITGSSSFLPRLLCPVPECSKLATIYLPKG